jgi:uncharacterized heparinase superfamily protein
MQAARLWRTVRHLRPVQVYGRLWFRMAQPRPDLSPAPALRQAQGDWQAPARRRASLAGPGDFRLLNEAGSLAEHGWDGPAKARLWRYNQHYFDDLNAEDAAARVDWHRALIADWIAANPPGRGAGWEPYPASLRIVNWVKWALAGNDLPEGARESLAVQTRWLTRRLEWHLLGNHLFANAKALVFAGLHFDGPEAARWLGKGQRILDREIAEQILTDGGQFELSPMYHALALEDMLDLVNIARTFGRDDLAAEWGARIPAMLDWLLTMSHPDGGIGFFNDAAFGIAPENSQLRAYARRLGFEGPQEPGGLRYLKPSGYARLSAGPAVVIANLARIGPDYLPGHAHADTLSFELSLEGRRVIVNSGTSVYGAGAERLRQRGTAAHSTLTINGQDSSEVWSGFRVGRRARPLDIETEEHTDTRIARAAHDGYRHLPGAPMHRREWRLDADRLTVTDRVEGAGRHRIEARFHLGPEISAHLTAPGRLELHDNDDQCILRVSIDGGETEILPSSWHPEFGRSIETHCIRVRADTELPCALRALFDWNGP